MPEINSQQGQAIGQPQIDALKVLIRTAHVCQSRGALTLAEAQIVGAAVDKLVGPEDAKAAASVGPNFHSSAQNNPSLASPSISQNES